MTIQTVDAHGAGHLNKVVASLDGFIRALVDHPNAVVIQVSVTSNGSCLRVMVAPGDMGQIVGKQGRTARSFRAILSAIGAKTGRRLELEICEEPSPLAPNP